MYFIANDGDIYCLEKFHIELERNSQINKEMERMGVLMAKVDRPYATVFDSIEDHLLFTITEKQYNFIIESLLSAGAKGIKTFDLREGHMKAVEEQ